MRAVVVVAAVILTIAQGTFAEDDLGKAIVHTVSIIHDSVKSLLKTMFQKVKDVVENVAKKLNEMVQSIGKDQHQDQKQPDHTEKPKGQGGEQKPNHDSDPKQNGGSKVVSDGKTSKLYM
ncbi:uncharacterized protein LOC116162539 [Photinus pyralis]|uniref:uncharacterized protein LOC116162539 n=1 Tax=Photinus pyralis TaxID=7054 RepID=UPI00126778E9|nr:uncharacterized protein LOC116162539 [Photinus pyralis]